MPQCGTFRSILRLLHELALSCPHLFNVQHGNTGNWPWDNVILNYTSVLGY